MAQEIKYTHKELVEAVQRLQSLCEYDKEVEASRKAGEILNEAIDKLENQVVTSVKNEVEVESRQVKSGFDDGEEFSLG